MHQQLHKELQISNDTVTYTENSCNIMQEKRNHWKTDYTDFNAENRSETKSEKALKEEKSSRNENDPDADLKKKCFWIMVLSRKKIVS